MLKKLMQSRPGVKLAVAESLTGGKVQALVTAKPGASDYFAGGVTAYAIDQKVALLGVSRAKAEACDSVSAEIAREMAFGVCRLMKTELGVATTGYAEPDRMKGVPAPKAHWAVCHLKNGAAPVFVDGFSEYHGLDRVAVQNRVAEAALATLVGYLEKLKPGR